MYLLQITTLLFVILNNFNFCCGETSCIATTNVISGSSRHGNSGGTNCTFPFILNEEPYNHCTRDTVNGIHLNAWCSTTDNYNHDRKWAYCLIHTFSGTADGAVCEFPFQHNGRTHMVCASTDERRQPWCKTADKKWGYCDLNCSRTVTTMSTPAITRLHLTTTRTAITTSTQPHSKIEGTTAEQDIMNMAGNQWVWICIGVMGLISIVPVGMFIGYCYKRYKQNHTPVEVQQEQLRVNNSAVYDEIDDLNFPEQIPRPPAGHPYQSLDLGIYLTAVEARPGTSLRYTEGESMINSSQVEAGADTSQQTGVIRILREDGGSKSMINDENTTEDGYLKMNKIGNIRAAKDSDQPPNEMNGYFIIKPLLTRQSREEKQERECSGVYETYDPQEHEEHPPQSP